MEQRLDEASRAGWFDTQPAGAARRRDRPRGGAWPHLGPGADSPCSVAADLPAIVHLLADDPLGASREADVDPLPSSYVAAFEAIDRDPNQELVVAVADERVIGGALQLTFIPYLTYQGSWRALIEGVRVAADRRSAGIGRRMIEWCIHRARQRGCQMVQLTSNKSRRDAIRFYEARARSRRCPR